MRSSDSVFTWRRLRDAVVVAGLTLLGFAQSAHAVTCGDTIGPGGTVSLDSDITCPAAYPHRANAALRVIGPVILDLNGHTLTCGGTTPRPSGIYVEGVQAQIRNGTISNCVSRITLNGPGYARHTVTDLTFKGNGTGIWSNPWGGGSTIARNAFHGNDRAISLISAHNIITHNTLVENGIGILFDQDIHLNRVLFNSVSRSTTFGFWMSCEGKCDDNTFIGNVSSQNGSAGFVIRGNRNTFLGNRALDNGMEGFRVEGGLHVLSGNVSKRNLGDGIRLLFGPTVVERNLVKKNKGHGIHVGGNGSTITSNTVLGHVPPKLDLVDVDPNCGVDLQPNTWMNNVFGTRSQSCIE